MTYSDVAETKRKAEAGDPGAQLALAKILAGKSRNAEALHWYRKAAASGNIEAIFQVGCCLLRGAGGRTTDQAVKADPATGIQLIFYCATNRYRVAYYEMHKAYRDGVGVPKDIVQVYAWLQLDIDTSPVGFIGPAGRQMELNRLALDLDVATTQQAKRLAALYKAGQWPTLTLAPATPVAPPQAPTLPAPAAKQALLGGSAKPAPKLDLGLKLNGIALGKTPLAIINGKSLAEGETATVPAKPKPVILKCIKIESASVLVSVEGEDSPRRVFRN